MFLVFGGFHFGRRDERNFKDQFLMGDDLLVAPMVTKGTARTVQIPSGKWKADDGTLITGPIQKTFAVPLGRLLYFERQQRPRMDS